jgi:hypothetical protein
MNSAADLSWAPEGTVKHDVSPTNSKSNVRTSRGRCSGTDLCARIHRAVTMGPDESQCRSWSISVGYNINRCRFVFHG